MRAWKLLSKPGDRFSTAMFAKVFRVLSAVLAFLSMGAPAAAADPDALIRNLGIGREPLPYEDLIEALGSADPRDRWLAASDLGLTGRADAAKKLISHLTDRNIEVRRRSRAALLSLAASGTPNLIDVIEKARTGLDPPADRTVRAIQAEMAGRPEEARRLYAEAYAVDPGLFWTAFHAFEPARLAQEISPALSSELSGLRGELQDNLDRPRRTYPLSVLRQAYGLVVFTEALGTLGTREAVRLMEAGRETEAAELRRRISGLVAAERELGSLAKEFELSLQQYVRGFNLSDDDPARDQEAHLTEERAKAARELGAFKSPKSEKALAAALTADESPLVRAASAEALGRIGTESAGQALIAALAKESSEPAGNVIVEALGGCKGNEVREFLFRIVEENRFKEPALAAIGRLGGPETAAMLLSLARAPRFLDAGRDAFGLPVLDREELRTALIKAIESAAGKRSGAEKESLLAAADQVREAASEEADQTGVALTTESPAKTVSKPAPAPVDPEFLNFLDAWLAAWRKGDAEAYIAHYHPAFRSKDMDRNAYRDYKKSIFGRQHNVVISAEDIAVESKNGRATISFKQDYRADGYSDYGLKKLVLARQSGKWLIEKESWEPLPRRD